ncbi:hypothetical protein A5757_13740 [Mycobacterium sp. 852013-51886_SCH5428379]|uniref:Rv0361 family membrane protein n=1 Tax=Mycobacterium sp. 852013-51886_SCH5428379 TaxID=1834111 RepID=UPI0007FFDBC2|nr:hypothetical protein [Mycobacterium sp. 852013-51886_SCH5428379]OBB59390.1 hypothetical protein A5757_13740 [Mycobacterium sp. 852013-51886_SCH5428379]
MSGPYPYPEPYPSQQPGPPPGVAQPYPGPAGGMYPGMLPPPVPYRKRPRGTIIAAVAAVLAIVGVIVALVVSTRDSGGQQAAGPLTDETARTTIQDYLNALSDGDDETIARNTLCGLFDAVTEKRSDMALAGLAGDAFRKQFSKAEVTSIDTIVPWSSNQAQVLFTMRVAPAAGSTRSQKPPEEEVQAVAQLLIQPDDVLVCSYLLRSGGQY